MKLDDEDRASLENLNKLVGNLENHLLKEEIDAGQIENDELDVNIGNVA